MYRERKKGLAYSVALHILLLLLMIFGLPSLLKNDPLPEPAAITVEILPISKISNVKPSDSEEAEKPKPEEPKEDEAKKPSPPVKTPDPTPSPPEPVTPPTPIPPPPQPESIKKPEKPPEPIKKPDPPKPPEPVKKPKKPKEYDLTAILKSVRDDAAKEKTTDKKEPPKEKTSPTPKAISSRFDPSQQMSISEKDAIMGQLAKCWNPPAGAKNAHELVVVIDAEFNQDGGYIRADIASESRSRYNSDSFYRAAADAALRAVRQCGNPLKNLDPAKYDTWKSMELHFDPREMLQ